jgi:DNA repair protein RecO (recombination protein O)
MRARPVEWTDIGIVLGARRHGETSAVLELMTRQHGRHLGLVRGGAGSRLKPVLQAGNLVSAVWRARSDENLGYYVIEPLDLRTAAFLYSAHALFGIQHLAALCRLLPERDPHPGVFDLLEHTVANLRSPREGAALVAAFELELLTELGFGLDLSSCAATGATEDLVYVSPRSGRAVSRSAGLPWHGKLLALPPFLTGGGTPSAADLRDAFALTGFFLARRVYDPRDAPLPEARHRFLAAVMGPAP